jgi:hypothetical protein
MDSILHQYLTKLRIISKIPEHGKLDTTQNDLNIYYGTIMNWVWRKFSGDSKDCTTKYLVGLYREINSFSDQLMYNIKTEQNAISKNKKLTMLVSLTEKVKESLTGIRNLIGTYQSYLKVVSVLECLEQDIIIPQYHTLKKFIPLDYHTGIIKSAISHSHIHMSTGVISSRGKTLSESNAPEVDMTFPGYTSPQNNILSASPMHPSSRSHSYTQPGHMQTQMENQEQEQEQEQEPADINLNAKASPAVRSSPINIPNKKGKNKKNNNSLH